MAVCRFREEKRSLRRETAVGEVDFKTPARTCNLSLERQRELRMKLVVDYLPGMP